jgi:Mn2+/Fe2+ NRAMP family transporter
MSAPHTPSRSLSSLPALGRLGAWAAVFGPGLVVMLADTDVGSVVTAAQSGVQWGYRLLGLQFVLIPILYVVQELTIRLGVVTGRGHGDLICARFGRGWGVVSVAGLAVAVCGALITEFSGIAAVADLFGTGRGPALGAAVLTLLVVAFTGSYRRVERVALAFGAFELAFLAVAWLAHPEGGVMLAESLRIPYTNPDYLYLAAANVGAVIMPWMIFYQQSAIAEKKLTPLHLRAARWDTALGAIVTQLVMAAVLIAAAATIGRHDPKANLSTVSEISNALIPYLGPLTGRIVFSLGVMGAAMVAAIVVSLALAWGVGEVAGFRHTLEARPAEAPWFYAVYAAITVGSGLLVWASPDLVSLNIAVEVMNALLLPLVLGFLVALARFALPAPYRLKGAYFALVLTLVALTSAFGLYGGLSGLGGG